MSVKVVSWLFFATVVFDIAVLWFIPAWSLTVPDAVHSSPMKFRGGATYFIQPWLAKLVHDADWLAVGLGVALFLLFWLHRDKLERY